MLPNRKPGLRQWRGPGFSNIKKIPIGSWPFPKTQWKKKHITSNKRNKHEIKIAHQLGGDLTNGSGAINNDADIRLDGFLIEHKARSEKVVSLPIKIWKKIEKQANTRLLMPLLVVSHIESGTDLVVMPEVDANIYFQESELAPKVPQAYKQIHIDFARILNDLCTYNATFVCYFAGEEKKYFSISKLITFKNALKNRGK